MPSMTRWSTLTVTVINPAYTSKTCSECGNIWTHSKAPDVARKLAVKASTVRGFIQKPTSKLGRVTQAQFNCSCGHEAHADYNAAINIARRGLAIAPPTEKAA